MYICLATAWTTWVTLSTSWARRVAPANFRTRVNSTLTRRDNKNKTKHSHAFRFLIPPLHQVLKKITDFILKSNIFTRNKMLWKKLLWIYNVCFCQVKSFYRKLHNKKCFYFSAEGTYMKRKIPSKSKIYYLCENGTSYCTRGNKRVSIFYG